MHSSHVELSLALLYRSDWVTEAIALAYCKVILKWSIFVSSAPRAINLGPTAVSANLPACSCSGDIDLRIYVRIFVRTAGSVFPTSIG